MEYNYSVFYSKVKRIFFIVNTTRVAAPKMHTCTRIFIYLLMSKITTGSERPLGKIGGKNPCDELIQF